MQVPGLLDIFLQLYNKITMVFLCLYSYKTFEKRSLYNITCVSFNSQDCDFDFINLMMKQKKLKDPQPT